MNLSDRLQNAAIAREIGKTTHVEGYILDAEGVIDIRAAANATRIAMERIAPNLPEVGSVDLDELYAESGSTDWWRRD